MTNAKERLARLLRGRKRRQLEQRVLPNATCCGFGIYLMNF
jgi:hypothetical protein